MGALSSGSGAEFACAESTATRQALQLSTLTTYSHWGSYACGGVPGAETAEAVAPGSRLVESSRSWSRHRSESQFREEEASARYPGTE